MITKNAEADKLLENIKEIENSKKDDSRRMFKTIQEIIKKSNTNIVECNSTGEIAGNTSKKIKYITDHFKKQFYKDSEKPFPEITPQKLDNPFKITVISL